MSAKLSIRLSDELESSLEDLSKQTGRTKSDLAREALESFVEVETWELEELGKEKNTDFFLAMAQ